MEDNPASAFFAVATDAALPTASDPAPQFDASTLTAADASLPASRDPVPLDNAIAPVIDLGAELSFPNHELHFGIREDERRGWLADFIGAGVRNESRFGKLRISVPERFAAPSAERLSGRALAAPALSSPASISAATPLVRS